MKICSSVALAACVFSASVALAAPRAYPLEVDVGRRAFVGFANETSWINPFPVKLCNGVDIKDITVDAVQAVS